MERVADQPLLDVAQVLAQVDAAARNDPCGPEIQAAAVRAVSAALADVRRQVLALYGAIREHDREPLDQVLELTDVARPRSEERRVGKRVDRGGGRGSEERSQATA